MHNWPSWWRTEIWALTHPQASDVPLNMLQVILTTSASIFLTSGKTSGWSGFVHANSRYICQNVFNWELQYPFTFTIITMLISFLYFSLYRICTSEKLIVHSYSAKWYLTYHSQILCINHLFAFPNWRLNNFAEITRQCFLVNTLRLFTRERPKLSVLMHKAVDNLRNEGFNLPEP